MGKNNYMDISRDKLAKTYSKSWFSPDNSTKKPIMTDYIITEIDNS